MIIEMFKTVKNSMIKMELYQKIDRESRFVTKCRVD